ncbi:TPA: hypothetical protein ACHSMM_004496 [Yersinia enterocolitica]
MRITVDSFAQMLDVEPGELVHAVRTQSTFHGHKLPAAQRQNTRHHDSIGTFTMDLLQAMAFVRIWDTSGATVT